MKRLRNFIIVTASVTLLAIAIISIQRSQKSKVVDTEVQENYKYFLNNDIYGIVTEVRRTDKDHLNPTKNNFLTQGLELHCTDINTQEIHHFNIDIDYEGNISKGDTIVKKSGDRRFCIYLRQSPQYERKKNCFQN